MDSHFACAVIYRARPPQKNGDGGGVEFLVIDYRSTNPRTKELGDRQTKFPGGTNREYPGESVVDTMARETFQETYLKPQRSKEIWKRDSKPDLPGETHTQHGFLVNVDDCRGVLRAKIIIDNGDLLLPPRWVRADTLGRELFHSHQGPYLAACRELGLLR